MRQLSLVPLLCIAALSCRDRAKEQQGATASATTAAPVASGLPGDLAPVARAVNPKNEKPYSGPTATVRGTVRVSGDPPTEHSDLKIGSECPEAKAFYGKAYRQGAERTLADVLVTVTGYQGYVPEREPVVRVEAKDCTWGTRTLALTFGQSIDVVSKDKESYVPELLGGRMKSQLVATPFGKGVAKLFPHAAGRYVLIDNLRLFMTAEVLVMNYATHDVTGLDGKFEITGVPVGKVTVNVLSPQTGATAQREVELEAGETEVVDVTLPFDAAKYESELEAAAKKGAPAPSASVPAR